MKDGFIRAAAATPTVKVADPVWNGEQILGMIQEGNKEGAKIMVFPELCLTAYTCGDLFLQDELLKRTREELEKLIDETAGMDMLIFIGLPWQKDGKLYNVAAAVQDGELLGLVAKRNLPNYSEFYELRHLRPARRSRRRWNGEDVLFPSAEIFYSAAPIFRSLLWRLRSARICG